MEPLTILIAEETDAQALSKISVAAKQSWNYPATWMRRWMEDLAVSPEYIRDHFVYKLVLRAEIIGFCGIEKEGGVYEVAHLWILPHHIGLGYGKRLLREVINRVVPPGALVTVVADPNAEAFYQSQEFSTFGLKESFPKGRFLPVMKKIV